MNVRFRKYNSGYKIVSIAVDQNTKDDLEADGLDYIFVTRKEAILYPDNILLDMEENTRTNLLEHNYDVCEIWPDGRMFIKYNNCSIDNYFFITAKCNSNCIMCPSSDYSRRKGENEQIDKLICIAQHIPANAVHLTITGGEPFLVGERIFDFIEYLKEKFIYTEFLFLTNGRIFAIDKYVRRLTETIPYNSIVAIPIHGSNARIHDAITRSKGSFDQTMLGIQSLLKEHIRIEIRIVLSQHNIDDIFEISNLIIKNFKKIEYVSIMSMEMTGNAYHNKEKIWIPYKQAFKKSAEAIINLIKNGIDVKLYNFPLCTVEKKFRTICVKSISPEKVRFSEECNNCSVKKLCGGVFAGTYLLEENELEPIP